MENILGLDLGTNSIGFSIRNPNIDNDIIQQFVKYGALVFKKGVGSEKGNEFSYAAKRTQKRSIRRLIQSRKYRIWETLDVLMKNGFCPITEDELNKWRRYDTKKGLTRKYPVEADKFEQWVKLDFDYDGIPDYSSPFQLRKELATIQLDLTNNMERYKIGRAFYHIAQRRGFKSSKGETIKEKEKEAEEKVLNPENEIQIDLQRSEKKIAGKLQEYISKQRESGLEINTVGWALAELENAGERIRENWIPIRQQYENEIKYIFDFQNHLSSESDFFRNIHKAIFYKRPLRSQKGLVGKCTLEPTKDRCPVSHPNFEEFRSWSFINNIQYKENNIDKGGWQNLDIEAKKALYDKCFMRTKANFKFEEIRDFLIKHFNRQFVFNYKDKANVAGCPVSARLKNLFGENWKDFLYNSNKTRSDKKGKEHTITYNIEDIWHVLISFEDEENVIDFAENKLDLGDKAKDFKNLWLSIPQGYSMLSLKAIKNINSFLKKGLIYTDATLLAKLPEILGNELWKGNESMFLNEIGLLTEKNRAEKRILNIANNLISQYKALSLDFNEQFAYKNTVYKLDRTDYLEIERFCIESFGEKTWGENISKVKQLEIKEDVAKLYQSFFSSSKRDYYRLPKLVDTIKGFLSDNFYFLQCENADIPKPGEVCLCNSCKKLNQLYHPSQIEIYAPAKVRQIKYNDSLMSLRLLESPKTGSFKNPMAMRTLHELRKLVNYLLKEGAINEDTRIIVETTRELNDANMRWAINEYQKQREAENKEFGKAILSLLGDNEFIGNANQNNQEDIEKVRILVDQFDVVEQGLIIMDLAEDKNPKKKKKIDKVDSFKRSPEFLRKIMEEKDLVQKYSLWKEQNFRCIYTGKLIKITDLFADSIIDFEHTIPRSISFDDSLENLTVCYADYNRNVKKKRIPSQLPEYEDLLPRIENWKIKVEGLKDNVEFWRQKSKRALTKDDKDFAIRQRHLWQMELDYWRGKYDRFMLKEVTSGYKNSQLVDTQLISKYALHYLKSVFNSVDVQKGSVTSVFRKIIGIQSEYEKKNRDVHSHHAIDASVLTLIPKAASRDRMLKLYYEKVEKKELKRGNLNLSEFQSLTSEIEKIENDLRLEIRKCKIGSAKNIVETIEGNIIINAVIKDTTLYNAKKVIRRRGRPVAILNSDKQIVYKTDEDCNVEYLRHKDGNLIFKKDEKGNFILDSNRNKTPIRLVEPRIATGDCIRGQLHDESFLGAIRKVMRDENVKPKVEGGKFVFEDGLYFVIRKELKFKKNDQDTGFKSLSEIEKDIVDPDLFENIKKQVEAAGSLKDAIDNGIYLLDKYGKPRLIDKNGHPLNKIRHIRVFVRSTEPLVIKKQTYISNKPSKHLENKDHKSFYYANNASNPYYALYQGEVNNKKVTKFEILSLKRVSELKELGTFKVEEYKLLDGNSENKILLRDVLCIGKRVIFFKNDPQEIMDMDHKNRIRRLYIITGFEKDGRIKFIYHSEAREDKKLTEAYPISEYGQNGKNGFSSINWDKPWPKLKLSKDNLNMLIENKDFEIKPDGEIIIL
jgi:CRISPR-associated endonuclease Csn1